MKTEETGRWLKQLTRFNGLFARRKQLKTLSVLLTGNGTTLACDRYLIFEQDLTSFYETGKLYLAVDLQGKCFDMEMEFSFPIIKSFAKRQKSRRDAFNRTKPDRMMKRKIPVTNPCIASNLHGQEYVCLFARGRT